MTTETSKPMSPILQAMAADHRVLEGAFEHTMASLRSADLEYIRQRWVALDRALERHLQAEEELVLPRLTQALPEVAARVLREHRQIRRALVQLGVDLDLHELCPTSAAHFIEAVRKHAAFEEAELYPWIQTHFDDASKQSLLARFRSHLHAAQHGERAHDVEQPALR